MNFAPVLTRAAGLLGFWLVLIGAEPGDLAAGALAAGAGAWASLRLRPTGTARVRPVALAALALRLAGQSLVGGAHVARRALALRPSLRPGFVHHALRLPPGPARDVFCALTSLVPGTLPAGTDERGALVVHCLDRDAFVAASLAADEALVARALGERLDG